MLYMVLERFHEGAAPEIYRRPREQGRQLPDGLRYVSWVDFEVIPVRPSADAAEILSAGS